MIKRSAIGYLIGWAVSITLAHLLRKTSIYRDAMHTLAVQVADEMDRRAEEKTQIRFHREREMHGGFQQ